MKKILLACSFIVLISFSQLAYANLSNTPWIPPTNANQRITTSNTTVLEKNYSSNYNFVGTGTATITGSNVSKTIYFNVPSSPINNHQGTYNQTLANNVVKNSGGQRINFINGTNNPVTMINDPTRNQINITISSTGSGGGVTSLNALTGALAIACVAGNTTCTSNGVNTITVNTAYNMVTTGLSAQTITKSLTLNSLTLGGNANGGNKNFTSLNNVNATKFFQNGTQVIDTLTQGSGISIIGSGHSRIITNTGVLSAITSINSQTGPAVNIVCQTGNTTCTNSTNQVKIGFGINPVITSGAAQTITKPLTINSGILGGDLNVGSNALTNNGHKSTLPLTTGTLCQTNQSSTCGTNSGVTSITGTAHNVTASASTGAVTLNTGDQIFNIVKSETISGLLTSTAGITMSGSNINLGTNQIIGTTSTGLQLQEIGGGILSVTRVGGNNQARLYLYGSGTSTASGLYIFRTSSTSNEFLTIGSDDVSSPEFAIQVSPQSGLSRPLNIYMDTTKLSSYDVSKTITNYVQNIWTPISDPVKSFTNAIWKSSTNTDVLKYRNNANTTTYNILSTLGAVTTSTPADPTGTTSTTAKMMGLAGSITPATSTRVFMTICGQMSNSLINDGSTVQLRYGIGTAPANAATLTGTQLGASQTFTALVAAQRDGYCISGIATGLTIGTAYWMDIALNANTAGTATITGNTITAHET